MHRDDFFALPVDPPLAEMRHLAHVARTVASGRARDVDTRLAHHAAWSVWGYAVGHFNDTDEEGRPLMAAAQTALPPSELARQLETAEQFLSTDQPLMSADPTAPARVDWRRIGGAILKLLLELVA